jgi:hypothetical protein
MEGAGFCIRIEAYDQPAISKHGHDLLLFFLQGYFIVTIVRTLATGEIFYQGIEGGRRQLSVWYEHVSSMPLPVDKERAVKDGPYSLYRVGF